MKLRLGYEMAKVHQDFQTFALIVSQALGGGKKSSGARPARTANEAAGQFASVFGAGTVKR